MTPSTRPLAQVLTGVLLTGLLTPALLSAQDASPNPAGAPATNASLHAPAKFRVLADKADVPVHFLLDTWGQASKRRVSLSPSIRSVRITLSPGVHELSRSELLTTFGRADVSILEDEHEIYALSSRELQSKIQIGNLENFEGDAPLPELSRPITWTCTIQNGAGSAIYANLRGILARDPTRSGNILYVQGPERLIVTDLAYKVDYYRQLVRKLDAPLGAQIVSLYRVPTKTWEGLQAKSQAEIHEALSRDPKVSRLEEVRATGADLTLKQNVEVGGRVMLVKLDLLTTQNAAYRHSPFRIKASVTEHAEGGSYQAEIDFVSPRTGPGAVTSVSFQGGQERLVILVRPLS